MPEILSQSATLLVKLPGQGSRHFELTHDTLTIGRKTDNTLVIEDPGVSGHHARIVKIQAVYFLEDLMSTNGTAINGTPITRHQPGKSAGPYGGSAICRSGSHDGAPRFRASARGSDSRGKDPDRHGENRSAGILPHKTSECHRVARRIDHSADRMVCP